MKYNAKNVTNLGEFVILASKSMLNQLSKNKNWLINVTFASCPKGFYQMLNIITYNNDIKQYIPSAHILMKQDTRVVFLYTNYFENYRRKS